MRSESLSDVIRDPSQTRRWRSVTNKAFMSRRPGRFLWPLGLVIYFLSTDLLSDMILRWCDTLSYSYWYFSGYTSIFFPSKMGAFFSTFRFYYLNPRNLLFAFIISSLVGFHISERLFMSEENSKFRMKLLPITSPLWSGFSRTLQKLANVVNTRFLKKLFQSKRKRNVFIKNRVWSIFSPQHTAFFSHGPF